jgi:hypothetical protein
VNNPASQKPAGKISRKITAKSKQKQKSPRAGGASTYMSRDHQ